jgi:hypothetical protein
VTAQHDDDTAPELVRIDDGADEPPEISRYENIGKRIEERPERAILSGR